MTLKDYLAQEGHTATALAGKLGVAVSTITRAANGEVIPSYEVMQGIIKHTKGKVKPNDFFDFTA